MWARAHSRPVSHVMPYMLCLLIAFGIHAVSSSLPKCSGGKIGGIGRTHHSVQNDGPLQVLTVMQQEVQCSRQCKRQRDIWRWENLVPEEEMQKESNARKPASLLEKGRGRQSFVSLHVLFSFSQ